MGAQENDTGSGIDDDGFQTMKSNSSRRQQRQKGGAKNKQTNNNRQRRSTNNHTGRRQQQGKQQRNKKGFSGGGPSLSSRGWSKPSDGWSQPEEEPEIHVSDNISVNNENINNSAMTIDQASSDMANVVREELSMATTYDEKINASIASVAASTTMASLMASMGFSSTSNAKPTEGTNEKAAPTVAASSDFASFAKGQNMKDLLGDLGEEDPHWKEKTFPVFDDDNDEPTSNDIPNTAIPTSFAAFCKGQSTSDLLKDFGQADPDWKEKVIVETAIPKETSNKPLSSSKAQTKSKQPSQYSKLAPHGKAPIHLSIESFGTCHGAPSRGARDRSGSPHTQPLEWLDVGDAIVDPIPDHLAFHDGLRSGVVKRLLANAPLALQNSSSDQWNIDDDDDESSVDLQSIHDFSNYCKQHLAETKIFPSLLEAIHEGGHGYVNPLTMRFSIGSSLGRHRSVVATEWIAQHLRHLLRTHNQRLPPQQGGDNTTSTLYNPKDKRPIVCSVSVGTVHRDVNKRIPQKHYKEDDEDYVEKKDRV